MTENLKVDDRAQQLKDIMDIQEKDLNIDDHSKNNNKENGLIEKLRGGIEQARGFLLEELIKIGTASSNKTININDQNVKQAIQSLIYADPDDPKNKASGGGALSIIATIKDNNKQIAKWEKEGYNSEAFNGIKNEMEKLPKQLEIELSTQKGLDSLINERVKNNILKQISFFKEDGQTGLNAIEKNNVIGKINKYIKISQDMVSTLLQDHSLLRPLIGQITKNASNFFGKDGANIENVCILDEKKLTDENILNFTHETNHTIRSFELIQKGINRESHLDVIKNQRITETLLPAISNISAEKLEQNGTKIVKILTPILKEDNRIAQVVKRALPKLDTDYIVEYGDKIINSVQEINDKGTSLWEKFISIFTGKDYLGERLEQSVNKYAALSDEHVKKEIDNKIFSNALTNEQIAAGLTKLMNKTVEPKEVNNPNLNLVEIRKANPEIFDKLLFANQSQTSSKDKPDIHQENQKVRTRGPGL